ncbi:hypothetical protein Vadar_008404 [Vaccinium darrowii]|uniref:Uncharacterized protein n=1 Tax=Vaccinium darrowii TaxID=229202 RepID=A0ACB7XPA6_9ERIC|nr:hypothetical protein Vadar_008404 [Vaccinium darrowii]
MAYTSAVCLFLSLLSLPLASTLPTVASPPTTAGSTSCTSELVAFSPCLPYVASPPNNISSSPSSDCCGVFSLAFDTGAANCLCYAVRRPAFFGFPLNSTKLFSLSSLCPLQSAGSNVNRSLESLCSGLSALPPLRGIIGPRIPRPADSGPDRSSPPVKSSLMPDSDRVSAATPSPFNTTPTHHHATLSSASKHVNNRGNWFPLGTIVLLPQYASLILTICAFVLPSL